MSKTKKLTPKEFEKMHGMQLDLLKEFDRVCRKNNIKYTIWGGTLLGAIRHKGFIPWDDDMDVAMLREEYEKFKKVINQLDPELCYLQDNDTDPYYRWGYAKLRRTYTRFVRTGQEHLKNKTGVFIDILPLDDIPKSTMGQMINDFHCFCIRKILYSEVGKYSNTEKKFARSVYNLLSKIPTNKVFKHFNKMTSKSRNNTPNLVRTYLYTSIGKLYGKHPLKQRYGMPKEWFIELEEYEFDGYKFYGCKDYNTVLTFIYNDYMKLPPKNKREPHAPVSDYSFDTRKEKTSKK